MVFGNGMCRLSCSESVYLDEDGCPKEVIRAELCLVDIHVLEGCLDGYILPVLSMLSDLLGSSRSICHAALVPSGEDQLLAAMFFSDNN